ncbi:MAG TPA: aminodeoxychorismate lyase [Gammaproteobacteria bacterium]|jgi:4-amino-4-deoxychorismate lyase|nr:aminodeoxychorismate lyase [Gammaproteobacteria bacterium]MBT6477569.1 aminodeoxychorismate lyase [Gammaproteobacteria bacterium]MBT6652222.1 aminodeoxychorismate lyase [Gammaproteobacteria bacterium]MBT6878364.1 aminodeoxychorismate lyase [Gammaproteobacteria bacterium]MBT7327534.1 aminodeoxychorismate lyase [Gammaproteobacteria bacterium]
MLLNGIEQDLVSGTDRGLLYGDGLFETIAVIDQTPLFLEQHLQRLQRGGERLQITIPAHSLLRRESEQLLAAAGPGQWVLKIIITRGAGGRGYRISDTEAPTRLLSVTPSPYTAKHQKQMQANGVKLYLCKTTLGENPALAGIKHLNRLEQVLARNEWSDPSISEGIVMNGYGKVIEGTMSNLFFIQQGRVITPDLSRCGVEGVMRNLLIKQLKQQGIAVTVRPIAVDELSEVDEAFCCNSLIGVWPIRQIGNHLSLNAPGAVTENCIQWLKQGT